MACLLRLPADWGLQDACDFHWVSSVCSLVGQFCNEIVVCHFEKGSLYLGIDSFKRTLDVSKASLFFEDQP